MATNQTSKCPTCGDTRLIFNPRPHRGYDEGDLYHCIGCGVGGESTDLIEPKHCENADCANELRDDEEDICDYCAERDEEAVSS